MGTAAVLGSWGGIPAIWRIPCVLLHGTRIPTSAFLLILIRALLETTLHPNLLFTNSSRRSGRYLMTGNQSGYVSTFDLWLSADESTGCIPPWHSFASSYDAVNGLRWVGLYSCIYLFLISIETREFTNCPIAIFSIHPYLPLAAAASGQRHFSAQHMASSSDEDSDNEQPPQEPAAIIDNQIRLFWYPQQAPNTDAQ